MATSSYDNADLSQARQSIAAVAGKYGSVGDGIPNNVDAGMFGTLPNSAAVAAAVKDLCTALRTEYAAAERLVGQIERALDATEQGHSGTEQNNKHSFIAEQVV